MARGLKGPDSAFNRRVLRTLAPAPHEALQSFLFRLARFNFYTPNTLNLIWRDRLRNFQIDSDAGQLPVRTVSYRILSELTGISAEGLYTLTGHALATVLIPPYLEIPTLQLPDQRQVVYLPAYIYNQKLRPARAVPYCPLCLAESPVYRLPWLTDLVICPQHQVVLLDACAQCQEPLSMQAISSGSCPRCAFDLTRAQPKSIADDVWGLVAQNHLQAWFGFTEAACLPDLGLPATSPRVLYALINGLHRCLRRRIVASLTHDPPAWPATPLRAHSLGQLIPTEQHYRLMTTAFQALIHWPDNFWAFMDRYSSASQNAYFSFKQHLGMLYTVYLQGVWQHPDFHFVQQAFDAYFLEYVANKIHLERYRHLQQASRIQTEQNWVDASTARQLLGVSKTGFYSWVEKRVIIPVQHQPVRRFDRAQILALRDFRQTHISELQAARLLNLTTRLTTQLIHLGVLPVHTFPAYVPTTHWVTLAAVQTLQQRLQMLLIPGPYPPHFYSMRQLTALFSARHLTNGQILLAVLNQQLSAYYLPSPQNLALALRFDPEQLGCFAP